MDDKDVALLKQILMGRSVPDLAKESEEQQGRELFGIFSDLITIRQVLNEFAQGRLDEDIAVRGVLAGSLKTLQAHLRHLTWQVQQVAAGDFTQHVDFMGDFSAAFNLMVSQLDEAFQKIKDSEQRFAHQAMYDSLTGLPNRILLNDRLTQYVTNSLRTGQPFIYAALDLDFFKSINDTYGHAIGDVVLKEFAQKISSCLREADTAARIGGDEFVFICTCREGEEEETINLIIKRFYQLLEVPVYLESGQVEYVIRSSVGVSFFPRHACDLISLFRKADEALYRSKEKGRNTYTVWAE